MGKIENGTDDNLARFVEKAKKRLNKKADLKEQESIKKGKVKVDYQFVRSNKKEEEKQLAQKIKAMLTKNPDIINPIGELMDKELVSKMTEAKRLGYILRLSKSYIKLKK